MKGGPFGTARRRLHDEQDSFCQAGTGLSQGFDSPLTNFGEALQVNGESPMAALDSLNIVRNRIGDRIAEIEERVARLKPIDICAKMEAIRLMAAEHGLAALEGLADYGAHHALMPGHVAATRACLEHMDEALMSEDAAHDRESILAALAMRIH
jgi:hypothetical protein